MRRFFVAALALSLPACASAREADLQAWHGTPVAALDTHPTFRAMPVVKTIAVDGTEVRHYVNGRVAAKCISGGLVTRSTVDSATYGQFTSCMQNFPECNSIFHIKNGIVTAHTRIATGSARCYPDESTRPGFRGATGIY
jgi:hypothetical protein